MAKHKINLQLFAEQPQDSKEEQQQEGTQQQNSTQQQADDTPLFDYEKLAGLISGKQSVAEDTVLKNYFKQQGMSKEEMQQAISAFKAEKAKNQPDMGELQSKLTEAQKQAREAALNQAATLEAVLLGIDVKTIPYLLRMADIEKAANEDGTVDQKALKEAINKVLEDIPALKPAANESRGFQYAGSGGNDSDSREQSDVIAGIFGNTR